MPKWSANVDNWTPTAVADATNFTNAGYMALQGGSSTQRLRIWEITLSGLAAAAAPQQLKLSRDSTVGVTSLTGVLNAALDPATAALAAPPAAFNSSTTKPQRSSTLQLLNCAFNAFGGLFRWQAGEKDDLGLLGNTASLGELSISSLATGTPGLMSAHMIYEPL